jgi:serine/threonine-protein kinase
MNQQSQSEQPSYQLLSKIAEGGFGEVWKGKALTAGGLSRPVAIKLLHAEFSANPELVCRLKDEARLSTMIQHRALVAAEDVILLKTEQGDRWALIMEWIEGQDLQSRIKTGPLSPRAICELGAELAAALATAQSARDPITGRPLGLVHRDIKPANILIGTSGEVRLVDFGVARAQFADRESQTRSGLFGSEGYIAPERFEGRETPAGDIYSLGITLIEAALGAKVGQLPVDSVRHRKKVEELRSKLESIWGELGKALVRQLLALVAYEPEDRPGALVVEERLVELGRQAGGSRLKVQGKSEEPTEAVGPGTLKHSRSGKLIALGLVGGGGLGVGLILLLGVLLGVWFIWSQNEPAPAAATPLPTPASTTVSTPVLTPAAKPAVPEEAPPTVAKSTPKTEKMKAVSLICRDIASCRVIVDEKTAVQLPAKLELKEGLHRFMLVGADGSGCTVYRKVEEGTKSLVIGC